MDISIFLGYYFANTKVEVKSIILMIIMLLLLFLFKDLESSKILNNSKENLLLHVFGGIALYFIGYWFFQKLRLDQCMSMIKILDRYSFHVYITHQIFVLGAFSMIDITGNLFINIVLILLLVIASALLLNKISEQITLIIKNKIIAKI